MTYGGRLGTKRLAAAGLRLAFAAGRASHEKRAGAAIAMVCLLEARLGAKLLEAAGLRTAFAAGRASHKKAGRRGDEGLKQKRVGYQAHPFGSPMDDQSSR